MTNSSTIRRAPAERAALNAKMGVSRRDIDHSIATIIAAVKHTPASCWNERLNEGLISLEIEIALLREHLTDRLTISLMDAENARTR